MAESKVVQVRKRGGLDRILVEKNKGPIEINEYSQKIKDRNSDGTYQGKYKGHTIPDTKHGISPMWSRLQKQWSWGADFAKLADLITKMRLRYPKGHDKEGQFITAENAQERLTYFYDDLFRHPDLYGRFNLENGKLSLNLDDPIQEFLYYCYKGSKVASDKTEDTKVNKYAAGSIKYDLISPKQETLKKKKNADKEVKAFKLLAALDGDEERMRSIAEVMSLPGYDKNTEPNGVFLLLKDMAAQNTDTSPKYGNKTYQDRFIEVASMSDQELDTCRNVITAKNVGIIRLRKDHFDLNGEKIMGQFDEMKLISYFNNIENQEKLLELISLIDNYKLDGRIS